MVDVLKLMRESRKLPPGHTGKRHAQKAIEKEYEEARRVEGEFIKSYKGPRSIPSNRAESLIRELCGVLLCRAPKKVLFWQSDHSKYDGMTRAVHLICYANMVNLTTLVHETAHSIVDTERMLSCEGNHRGDFLWVEEQLFDAILNGMVTP